MHQMHQISLICPAMTGMCQGCAREVPEMVQPRECATQVHTKCQGCARDGPIQGMCYTDSHECPFTSTNQSAVSHRDW